MFKPYRVMRNVLIVLNERAGSLLDRDPLAVKAALRRRLARPGRTVDVLLAHKRGIGRAIDRGAASDYDTIIVGGGDGSVGHAANRLAASDKTFGVLPLGTVNLFARDIGAPANLDDAIAAIEASVPRAIDLGMLNGRAFHTLSGLGFFSQMARAREETRDLPGKALRVMAAAARADAAHLRSPAARAHGVGPAAVCGKNKTAGTRGGSRSIGRLTHSGFRLYALVGGVKPQAFLGSYRGRSRGQSRRRAVNGANIMQYSYTTRRGPT